MISIILRSPSLVNEIRLSEIPSNEGILHLKERVIKYLENSYEVSKSESLKSKLDSKNVEEDNHFGEKSLLKVDALKLIFAGKVLTNDEILENIVSKGCTTAVIHLIIKGLVAVKSENSNFLSTTNEQTKSVDNEATIKTNQPVTVEKTMEVDSKINKLPENNNIQLPLTAKPLQSVFYNAQAQALYKSEIPLPNNVGNMSLVYLNGKPYIYIPHSKDNQTKNNDNSSRRLEDNKTEPNPNVNISENNSSTTNATPAAPEVNPERQRIWHYLNPIDRQQIWLAFKIIFLMGLISRNQSMTQFVIIHLVGWCIYWWKIGHFNRMAVLVQQRTPTMIINFVSPIFSLLHRLYTLSGLGGDINDNEIENLNERNHPMNSIDNNSSHHLPEVESIPTSSPKVQRSHSLIYKLTDYFYTASVGLFKLIVPFMGSLIPGAFPQQMMQQIPHHQQEHIRPEAAP